MSSPSSVATAASFYSRSPDALLSFTANTANNLLPCNPHRTLTHHQLPSLSRFVHEIFQQSHLPPSIMVISLIYLHRLKSKLPAQARGDFDTPFKLFLAAILVASKYTSECGTSLTSQMVSRMTNGLYTAQDVNHMERSFLGLIKYDLWVDVDEVRSFLDLYGDTLEVEMREIEVGDDGMDWDCFNFDR